jgi:hypothetical protein
LSDEDLHYLKVVKKVMMHNCCEGVNGCLKNGNRKIKYSLTIVDETHFNETGYAIYERAGPNINH